MPFSFCSFQEQHQIVREIETRLSICDKLEETIAEALQKSEALRQSILKKAFEGKLLNEKELEEARNAPDWEPADKLLERINAEKEKPGTKKSF
jgi:type I restriction enzyme S subunit